MNKQASGSCSRQQRPEALLIEAAQQGSHAALEELLWQYRKFLYRVVYSITKNHEDAEDALQDAFLRACVSIGTFRRDAQFRTWLVRIAMNCALMLLRKRRRRGERRLGDDGEACAEWVLPEIQDFRPNPEQLYREKQRHAHLLEAIQELPQRLRIVAELRILGGKSIVETQEILGITKAAIKTRTFRACARLGEARSDS